MSNGEAIRIPQPVVRMQRPLLRESIQGCRCIVDYLRIDKALFIFVD